MQPRFTTLLALTLITSLILLPFALSADYLPTFRDRSFELYQFLHRGIYKQVSGYIALLFVLLEMILTLRKRGRNLSIKVPGSIRFWRWLHILMGVALVAVVLFHTIGATGRNFNAAFLWVFWGAGLSALVGVVAETGILESSQSRFSLIPTGARPPAKWIPIVSKGPLIRGMRLIWLSTHILFVSVFFVMLGFHIFLAYHFQ